MKKLYCTLLLTFSWHVCIWAQTDVSANSFTLSTAATNGCGSATEPITIEIINVGTSAAPVFAGFEIDGGAQIVGPESVGTISPDDTVWYTFTGTADLSAIGPHSIGIAVSTAGDVNNTNDSLTTDIVTFAPLTPSLPIVDFTGFNSTNLSDLFSGWREASGTGTPTVGNSLWVSDQFGNDNAHPNGTAAKINLWDLGKEEWLISPRCIVGANTHVQFDLALTAFGVTTAASLGSDDVFQVLISTDCGVSYTPIATYDANSSISNTGQAEEYDISTYSGQEVFLAFYGSEGSLNDPVDLDLFIDNLRIAEVVPDNVGAISIAPSAAVVAGCGNANEPLTILVKNEGTTIASGITASFSIDNGPFVPVESIPGTLAPDSTVSYTFTATADLSGAGQHSIVGLASITNDGVPSNDTTTTSVTINPTLTPSLAVVDFSGFTGTNLSAVFPGWSEGEGIGTPSGTNSSWDDDDFGNVIGGTNGRSAKINLWDIGKNSWLMSPVFSASVNTQLSYDIALTNFNGLNTVSLGSDDVIRIMVSTDCGISYSPFFTYDSSSVISSTGQSEILSLAAYSGQDIKLAFFASEGVIDDAEDNDVFIDNINIRELNSLDVELLAISSPASAACFLGQTEITVDLKNDGTDTLDFSTDPTSITVDITGANPGTYSTLLNTGTMVPGDTMTFVVTNAADLMTGGFNTLIAYVSSAADPNPANDTLVSIIESIPIVPLPFSEDFEGFSVGEPGGLAAGWTREFTTGLGWFVDDNGTPSGNTGPANNHTPGGSVYMFTEVTGGNEGDRYLLYSPCIDVSGINTAALSFYYHMYGITMGTLEVDIIHPNVDTTTVFSISGQQQFADTDPWINAIVDISTYIGDTIQLCFRGIVGVDFMSDMAIDDIEIFELATHDVEVTGIAPRGNGREHTSLALGSAEDVIVDITNNGVNDAANFQVEYWINGTLVDTDTIVDTLASGESLQHTFSVPADFSAAGSYELVALTQWSLDVVPENDTIGTSRIHYSNPPLMLPYEQGFENTDTIVSYLPFVGMAGADRFDYENTDPGLTDPKGGRLRTAAGPGFNKSGNRAITLDRDPGGDMQINYLTATLNLSSNTMSDTLLLDFSFMNHGEEPQPNDRVWVRGNDTASWIEIVDLNAIQGDAGFYQVVENLNLTSALAMAGQSFSTSTQIRFGQEDNFSASSISAADGYTFDDIIIRKLLDNDVVAEEILDLQPLACGDSASEMRIVIGNKGLQAQDTVPVLLMLTDPTGGIDSFVLVSGPIPFGGRDTLSFGPINTLAGGEYMIKGITQLGTEQNVLNDTITQVFSILTSEPPVAMGVAAICEGDSAEMIAVGEAGINFEWYDAPIGGNLLGLGDTLSTGPLSASTSLFLAVATLETSVGPADTTFGNGDPYDFFTDGLMFDVFEPLVLNSVRVFPSTDGEVVINLFADGQLEYSSSFHIPVGIQDTILSLNWNLLPGTGYQINADGSTVNGLYRNGTGVVFPYEIPGVISITSTINGLPEFYYFFYDWQISSPPCRDTRTEVNIDVIPAATASFTSAVTDLTVSLNDASSHADSVRYDFGDGNSSADPNPLYTYSDSGTFTICQIAYHDCGNDTTCMEVMVNCAFAEANFDFTYSEGTLVNFTSMAVNADSVVYDFGGGNTSSDPNASFDFGERGDYTVTMIAYNDCSTDSITIELVAVGIETFIDLTSLELFPNPTRNHFILNLTMLRKSDMLVEVENVSGQSIMQESFQGVVGAFTHRFELRKLTSGMYLVKIHTEDQMVLRKLQIE